MDTYEMLNDILVNLFRDINDLEEKALVSEEFPDITNNDMHVMEAIGINQEKNMSMVARKLSVTTGSLTISVNSLVKKGYVERKRGVKDRRVVYISLTDRGIRAYRHHEEFHKKMIDAVMEGMDEDELEVLVKALNKISGFFKAL